MGDNRKEEELSDIFWLWNCGSRRVERERARAVRSRIRGGGWAMRCVRRQLATTQSNC